MAIATVTVTTLAPTLTKATLGPAIQTAMNNAGFSSPIDTISSTTDTQIYSYTFNGSTKGTAFLRIDISDTTLRQQLGDSWNTATDTGTNFLGQNAISYTNSQTLTLYAINHDELRLVILSGANINTAIGYIRPTSKPSWWNENSHLYCFNPWTAANNPPGRGNVCGLNPFGIASAATANEFRFDDVRLIDANPGGTRDLVRSPYYSGTASPSRCNAGRFSADVAIGAGASMALTSAAGDKIQVSSGVEEYLVLSNSAANTAQSAIAVRVI